MVAAFTSQPRADFDLSKYILNVSIFFIQCEVFAFSHDTLKERIHALSMDKMHKHGIYILDVITVTSSFCSDTKSIWLAC